VSKERDAPSKQGALVQFQLKVCQADSTEDFSQASVLLVQASAKYYNVKVDQASHVGEPAYDEIHESLEHGMSSG